MIAVDTNLLVYAHRRDSTFHQAAVSCIRELAEGDAPWAIPWSCLHEFFGIVTHPKIYQPASTTAQASAQIDAWLLAPGLVLLAEGPRYWDALRNVVDSSRVAGPIVYDARIAALCIHHGIKELWSCDRDFSRFGGLRTRNPLTRR